MRRKAQSDRGLKVHSLGYMAEKLKRNLPDYAQRHVLTCTAFVRVSSEFSPSTRDERRARIEELARLGAALEALIQRLERMVSGGMALEAAAELVVAQDVTEARAILRRRQQNPHSAFYHHLRERLLAAASEGLAAGFRDQARDLGRAVRNAVRVAALFVDEQKLYVGDGEALDLEHDTVRALEREVARVRRVVVEP